MSDHELPPLPNKEKLHTVLPDDYRYGHIYGYTADQMREYARAVERAAYERAAQIVKPKSPRPCDCEVCDCGNSSDRRAVIQWDEATMLAAAIHALGRQHEHQ